MSTRPKGLTQEEWNRKRAEQQKRYRDSHKAQIAARWQAKYWAPDSPFRARMQEYNRERWTDEEWAREQRRQARMRGKRYTARKRADRRMAAAAALRTGHYNFKVGVEEDDLAMTLGEFREARG